MPIVTTKDGSVHLVEHLENGNIRVDGLEIERPTTRAEAGAELSRRAIKMLREGRVTTMRAACTAAMDDDPFLKRIYAEGA